MRICPRCQRLNPDEAAFCYFDGLDLRKTTPDATDVPLALPVETGPARLPHEFVFPTGRHCFTYDDLMHGCLEDWAAARALLVQGALRQYLTGAGRLDLARAADEALRQQADPDLALDVFLTRLPATRLPKPELELDPHKLLLGTLPTGATKQVTLRVLNIGTGVLHGSVSVVDGGGWLRLAECGEAPLALKADPERIVVLNVDTRSLPAPQKCAAHLTVVTNGGIVEVPVRLDISALPFPHAPYQGAETPRDLAVRMRDQPKPAIALLESGEVFRWFEANGWAYPVVGPTAPKMAAVQQLFESLGLARAPRVQLSETEARFCCLRGEAVRGQVELSTQDRKWVYAHAASEAPWLRVPTPAVSGPQRVVVDFEVDSRALASNRTHEGTVRISANAGQPLVLRVQVDVRRPVRRLQLRWLRPVLVGAVAGLLLRLLAVPGGDGTFSPTFVRHLVATLWVPGALLGAMLIARRGSRRELPFGLIAGAVAGVAVGGTLACLMPLVDGLPRLLGWQLLSAWPTALAGVSWAALGALLGLGFGYVHRAADAGD